MNPIRSTLPVSLLFVAACFTPSPSPEEPDATGGETDDSTEPPGDSSSPPDSAESGESGGTDATTGAESSGDITDTSDATGTETSAGDSPPEITSFTVDGSETPAPVSSGRRTVLAAAAVDDIGIDRVEFYDGELLLEGVDAPPYETSVLVTSADNGSHAFRAVAYDTMEQSAEASADLTVDIEGGSTTVLETDVVDLCLDTFTLLGGPQLTVDSDGVVHFVATERYEYSSDVIWRLAYRKFDSDLDLVDSSAYPNAVDADTPDHFVPGTGALTTDESGLLHGVHRGGGEIALIHFDTTTMTGQTHVSFRTNDNFGSTAVDGAGNIYGGLNTDEVNGIAANLRSTTWDTPLEHRPGKLTGGPDYVVVDGFALTSPSELVVQRISSSGNVEWTRAVDTVQSVLSDSRSLSAIEPNTETIVTVYRASDDLSAQLRDADGTTLDALDLGGLQLQPWAIEVDAQQSFVIGGLHTEDSVASAAIGRYATDGEMLWSNAVDGLVSPAWISSIALGPDGALYAAGGEQADSATGCATGRAWIARIEL